MALQIKDLNWPPASEVLQWSAENFQSLIKQICKDSHLTTRDSVNWLYQLEHHHHVPINQICNETPKLLREFLNKYSPFGTEGFVRSIRTFLTADTIVVDSFQSLIRLWKMFKVDVFIWLCAKTSFHENQTNGQVIINPQSRIYNGSQNDEIMNSIYTTQYLERNVVPQWHEEWAVAIYHGNDLPRSNKSEIIPALNKATNKLNARRRRFNRLVRKRMQLTEIYIRRLSVIESRLDRRIAKIERSTHRINRLRAAYITGSDE